MHVIHHATLPRHVEGGCCRRTVAGAPICAAPFVVETVAVDPGSSTAPACGAPAFVVIALAGSGKLVLHGGPERFQAPCTLVVPAGVGHRFVNTGAAPLELVCVRAPGAIPEAP